MAARAGAVISDAEFVQFHPTAIDAGRDPAPLASEALRGEGATLVNSDGKRFMVGVHADAELAPRDIVARAVYSEVQAGRGAFLDCREAIGDRFPEAFPAIYEKCQAEGINPVTEPLPVAPAAHYHMGGVLTDANGRTTVDGIWACGEVASTGTHGANRLASNSLLETVVFGGRIAADLTSVLGSELRAGHATPRETAQTDEADTITNGQVDRLRQIMMQQVGVVRDREGLGQAVVQLAEIEQDKAASSLVRNMALAARFVAAAAYVREESRGGHFRSDFPRPRKEWARRSYLRLDDINAITAELAQKTPSKTNVVHAKFGT
jgi:L-aspartate oxidase